MDRLDESGVEVVDDDDDDDDDDLERVLGKNCDSDDDGAEKRGNNEDGERPLVTTLLFVG